jgi:hypothetical protein
MKFLAIVFSLFFASVLLAAPASKDAKLCAPVTPADARLELYPHADGPMSVAQVADLGLSPHRLLKPFTGFNFHRDSKECGGGSWRMEVIPAGEVVYRGVDGYIAYRASCWNRLVALPPPVVCPQAKPCPPAKACPPAPKPKKYLRWYWKVWQDLADWVFFGTRYE